MTPMRRRRGGIAARIARLVAGCVDPGDCAVLTRINAQQPAICAALRAEGLRYRVRRDSGWQNSALADDAQSRLTLLEAKGLSAAASSVIVSTIHASKGLEFPYVFIVGCSEGLILYGASIAGEALRRSGGCCMSASPAPRTDCTCRTRGPRTRAPVPIASPAASSADPKHVACPAGGGMRHVW